MATPLSSSSAEFQRQTNGAAALRSFFSPASVAIVGASANFDSINGKPLRFLLEKRFRGSVHPVNPNHSEIAGIPCLPSVDALPDGVDVALVLVRAALVPEVLRGCARRGVRFAIVFSAGFAEIGGVGARLQEEIRQIVAGSELRVVGPNCYGSLNAREQLPLGFATPFELPEYPVGGVGFFSQSGAFGYGFLTVAAEAGLGFSYILNTGNSVDLGVCDMLEFLAEDPATRVIGAYVEEIRDHERFARATRACIQRAKPVVVLKVGRTEVGARAARAHTASETGSPAEFDAEARRLGLTVARDPDELLDILKGLSAPALPRAPGVAVVTTSGAAGILFADAIESAGLSVPPLDGEVLERVRARLPDIATATNPIDTTAMIINNPRLIENVLEVLRDVPTIGSAAILIATPTGAMARTMAESLMAAAEAFEKPVVLTVTSGERYTAEFYELMRGSGIPIFQWPHRAARALRSMVEFGSAV